LKVARVATILVDSPLYIDDPVFGDHVPLYLPCSKGAEARLTRPIDLVIIRLLAVMNTSARRKPHTGIGAITKMTLKQAAKELRFAEFWPLLVTVFPENAKFEVTSYRPSRRNGLRSHCQIGDVVVFIFPGRGLYKPNRKMYAVSGTDSTQQRNGPVRYRPQNFLIWLGELRTSENRASDIARLHRNAITKSSHLGKRPATGVARLTRTLAGAKPLEFDPRPRRTSCKSTRAPCLSRFCYYRDGNVLCAKPRLRRERENNSGDPATPWSLGRPVSDFVCTIPLQ